MPDFVERLHELDRVELPDVWSDVQRMGSKTPTEPGPSPLRRVAALVLAILVAVASFVLVIRAFSSRGASQPGETPSPTPSTVGPVGNGLVAFGCGYQICTVQEDGSEFANLIDSYDEDLVRAAGSPVFSPDGSKIAFGGYNHQGSSSGGGANYDIFVMNADGSGVTNLTTSAADVQSGASQVSPRWSPDGSMIAYDDDKGLFVMNSDGSDQRRLAIGGGPTWAPDGTRIAFVMKGNLWTIHPDGTDLTQLTQSPNWPELPIWSPDGSRIAFLHGSVIYVVNADGTGLLPLVDQTGIYPFQPQWSPDGARLAFEADTGHDSDIYLVNADGSGLTAIARDPHLDENFPVWAPDGTAIAFGATDNLTGLNDGTWDLYVMRPDGTHVQRLTRNAHLGAEFDISWQRTFSGAGSRTDSSQVSSEIEQLYEEKASIQDQLGDPALTPDEKYALANRLHEIAIKLCELGDPGACDENATPMQASP